MFKKTTAYLKLLKLKTRLWVIQGGTSASKTVSIMLYLIDRAQAENGLEITVVSESLPHMKRGALKEFLKIMKSHGYYDENDYNRTDLIYTFPFTGSTIEFFGVDTPEKVHGPRRDILFINEANNVSHAIFDAMDIRTRMLTILDFNPTHEFWVHTEVMPNQEHDHLILTYKDNEALDDVTISKIEARKHNVNWWRVYGLGLVGKLEGLIFPNFEIIDEIPEEAQLMRHAVDYGYTNDESAIGDIYKWNEGYIIDELGYGVGMKNKQIANIIRASEGLPPVQNHGEYKAETEILTVGDSAEPKSNDDLCDYGVRTIGSTKGPGSVNTGIEVVQDQKLYITKRSTNIIAGFRGYQWKIDKRTGKSTNTPEHEFSHAPDMVRYGITDILGTKLVGVDDIIM